MPLINREMTCEGIERAFDEALATNGWLIFYGSRRHRPTQPMGLHTRTHEPCAGSGGAPQDPGFDHGGGVPMCLRLKRFVCHFGE